MRQLQVNIRQNLNEVNISIQKLSRTAFLMCLDQLLQIKNNQQVSKHLVRSLNAY